MSPCVPVSSDIYHLICHSTYNYHLFCRDWCPRRVVITDEVIVFSRVGENTITDAIPIAEIGDIEPFDKAMNESELDTKSDDAACAFQIRTEQDGFNSGRKYCFKAESIESSFLIVWSLLSIVLL